MSQLTVKLSDRADALIAQLQKEIFNRRRKKVSAAGVIETLVESGAKSQSDKRFSTSWKNLVADIEKAAKVADAHGAKPANLSDEEWAMVLNHRTRTPGPARKAQARKTAVAKKSATPRARARKAEASDAPAAPAKAPAKRAARKATARKPVSKTSASTKVSTKKTSSSVARRMAKAVSRLGGAAPAAPSGSPSGNGAVKQPVSA